MPLRTGLGLLVFGNSSSYVSTFAAQSLCNSSESFRAALKACWGSGLDSVDSYRRSVRGENVDRDSWAPRPLATLRVAIILSILTRDW
jgi:hypothetical protein